MKRLLILFAVLASAVGIQPLSAQNDELPNVYWGLRMGYDCSFTNKALPGFGSSSCFHSMTLSNVIGVRINPEPYRFYEDEEPWTKAPIRLKNTFLEIGIKARNICFESKSDRPSAKNSVSTMPSWYAVSMPVNLIRRYDVGKKVYISPFVGFSPKLNVATHKDDKKYEWQTNRFQLAVQAGVKINVNDFDFTLQYGRDVTRLLAHKSVYMNDIELTIGANW